MKKLVLLFALGIAIVGVNAQKGKVTSALNYVQTGQLDKAWEAIKLAETHEKSKDWPRTYYAKGRVLQAIAASTNEEYKALAENPLEQAYENYQKARSMDDTHKIDKDIDLMMMPLSLDFMNKGITAFNEEKFTDALKNFEIALSIEDLPLFGGSIDTSLMYNAGLAANNAGNYDKALEYYNKAKKHNYGGANLYVFIKNVELAKGDSTAAISTLQEGFNKFPENQAIQVELINYYLLTGDEQKALDFINLAKESDPTNPSFYFAEGTLYEKLGNTEKAYEAYNKAIEVDAKYFNAYYNLGVLHFNDGVKIMEKANNQKDDIEYNKMKDLADVEFKKAIPYMEKAHELDSKEVSTMETLKMLYYRLKMDDKHAEISKVLEDFKSGKVAE